MSEGMTEQELLAIEERCKKATPGPLKAFSEAVGTEDMDIVIFIPTSQWIVPNCAEDARFIAHARTDIPALIAEVRRRKEPRDE